MNDERAANAIDRKLGQRVRTRRLEIGMSQERLAELLGVTFQQVQKYEKGLNRIAASRLFDIAAALDMDVCAFFDGLGVTPKSQDRAKAILTTRDGAKLASLYAGFSPNMRRKVLELVEALNAES